MARCTLRCSLCSAESPAASSASRFRGFRSGTPLSCSIFLNSARPGLFLQKFKVAFTRNAGGAQVVLDDEHGDGRVFGDDHRTEHASFGVDEVVTLLPDQANAVRFQSAA